MILPNGWWKIIDASEVRWKIILSLTREFPELDDLPIPEGLTSPEPDVVVMTLQYDPVLDKVDPWELHDRIYRSVFQSRSAVPELVQGKYLFEILSFNDQGDTVLKTRVRSWDEWQQQKKSSPQS